MARALKKLLKEVKLALKEERFDDAIATAQVLTHGPVLARWVTLAGLLAAGRAPHGGSVRAGRTDHMLACLCNGKAQALLLGAWG